MSKNEAQKDINLFNFIKDNKIYKKDWLTKKTKNEKIQEILSKVSKKGNGNRGEPDFFYVNEDKKILILIENKDSIKQHASEDGISKPIDFAVDGIKHYLSFFTNQSINIFSKTTQNYFSGWKFVGIGEKVY